LLLPCRSQCINHCAVRRYSCLSQDYILISSPSGSSQELLFQYCPFQLLPIERNHLDGNVVIIDHFSLGFVGLTEIHHLSLVSGCCLGLLLLCHRYYCCSCSQSNAACSILLGRFTRHHRLIKSLCRTLVLCCNRLVSCCTLASLVISWYIKLHSDSQWLGVVGLEGSLYHSAGTQHTHCFCDWLDIS